MDLIVLGIISFQAAYILYQCIVIINLERKNERKDIIIKRLEANLEMCNRLRFCNQPIYPKPPKED